MTRWTFRILICLLLGVVTTVGVAWGLVLSMDARDGTRTFVYGDWTEESSPSVNTISVARVSTGSSLHISSWKGSPYHPIGWSNPDAIWGDPTPYLEPWSEEDLSRFENDWTSEFTTGSTLRCDLKAHGWPSLAMWCVCGQPFVETEFPPTYGITLPHHWQGDGPMLGELATLPLRPLYPGFLINTLFYAAIWFGLFFGLTATRRTIRRRRGRCPRCGYDLRGEFDSGCSECGWGRTTEAARE